MDWQEDLASDRSRTLPGSVIAIGLVLVAGFMAYLAIAMPGMDHGADSATSDYELVDAVTFEALLENRPELVVNVHVPVGREIVGTDAHIAGDELATSSLLPEDRAATILVYCRTGAVSADAADTLVAEGYTNVKVLRGGMEAWEASGRELSDAD